MLKTRILTACALALVFLTGLFLLPPPAAILAFGVVFTVGAWEWSGFGGLAAAAARIIYTAGIVLLCIAAWRWTDDPRNLLILLSVACIWWACAFAWICVAPNRQQPMLTLLCGALVLVPAFVALARLLMASSGFARGPEAVLCLAVLVVASDVGAYFVGRSFGRLKLAPHVSPAKTWEGAAGGIALVALISWVGALAFGLPVLPAVGFGCAIGLISIVGDLTESMFKRSAGLKDSGKLLPGHGGMLDRIDSVTAAAPLYALGLFSSGVLA
jgi:phosphatidate cytidylyltransferase